MGSSTRVYFTSAEDIFADISRSLHTSVNLPPWSDTYDLSSLPPCHIRAERHPVDWWPQLRDILKSIPKPFKVLSLAASGGSLILSSAGSFVLSLTNEATVTRDTGTFVDCATASFNCSDTVPRCSSTASFDFQNLWNITNRYSQQCPGGPLLFQSESLPSNVSQREWLSNSACEAVAGVSWSKYPSSDIW